MKKIQMFVFAMMTLATVLATALTWLLLYFRTPVAH